MGKNDWPRFRLKKPEIYQNRKSWKSCSPACEPRREAVVRILPDDRNAGAGSATRVLVGREPDDRRHPRDSQALAQLSTQSL